MHHFLLASKNYAALLPHPVNLGLAFRALAVLEIITPDLIAQAVDEQSSASIAKSTFPSFAGDIAGIDVPQSRLEPNLPGL